MQEMLVSEWGTIDNALHRLELSAKLENEINDHIFLKFPGQRFTCQTNGTISLPVSTADGFCVSVFVDPGPDWQTIIRQSYDNFYRAMLCRARL